MEALIFRNDDRQGDSSTAVFHHILRHIDSLDNECNYKQNSKILIPVRDNYENLTRGVLVNNLTKRGLG